MKKMVLDVAASTGGAITILNEFYEIAKKDVTNQWIFIISTAELDEKNNISIYSYPWIKKSKVHRIFFDKFVLPNLISNILPIEIINLQNIITYKSKAFQTLYLHQPLPFSEYRYSFFQSKEIWFYQNIYSKKIYNSLKMANKIIVQTEFMKKNCIDIANIEPNKINVLSPKLKGLDFDNYISNEKIKECICTSVKDLDKKINLFYPANNALYKNHKIIIDSMKFLSKEELKNINIIFTLKGNEDKNIKKLYKLAKKEMLPVYFVGYLEKTFLLEYYYNSVLIFPSLIETFGLPLLEAKSLGRQILASDTSFSHEILDDYNYVQFFDPHDEIYLSTIIKKLFIRD